MRFSITIPAFKIQFLCEAIESVIQQTYTDWELIIVDDFSPEDIKSVIQPYLTDKRIQYHRNNKNCGAINVVDNWNICLSYCTGDFVICIGDDDKLLPECLSQYKDLISKYPELNIFHAWTEIVNEKGKTIYIQSPRPEWESALSLIWNRWDNRDFQFLGDFCYRTSYLRKIGGYHKQPLAWGSDDITAAIAAKKKGIANTQVIGFQYRLHDQTISKNSANAELKIRATISHYNWFTKFINSINSECLSHTDSIYLQTIETARRKFFSSILGIYCSEYIKGNPFKLIKCCQTLKEFHFPKGLFVKWYITSIYITFFRTKIINL